MNKVLALIKSEYGIDSASASPAATGFSSKFAYCIKAIDGAEYYVKVYDKTLPTTYAFIRQIDAYMPVLDRLAALPMLAGRVLTPIMTLRGSYKAETAGEVFVLFRFIRGSVPGIEGVSRAQTVELAEILARLHDSGQELVLDAHRLQEDITLPFCEQLSRFLDTANEKHKAVFNILSPHIRLLRTAIQRALQLRDTVRTGYSPLILCHGDAHGNNVIQGERLVLADWEDLRLAPAEADLFIYAWHPHGDLLLEAYCAARPGFCVSRNLLFFYVLRRRVEDIWVDIQRLTEETPDEVEAAGLLELIRMGIEGVRALLCPNDEKKSPAIRQGLGRMKEDTPGDKGRII